MTFFNDLKLGNFYEKKAIRYFNYDTYEFCNDGRYDILIKKDSIETKIEVKSDRRAYETGNLAIEYKYKGCPSGIRKTEAEYYIYFVIKPDKKYDVYKFPIQDLNILCRGKKSVCGGDNNQSIMYLLPINLCEKYKISIKK